MAISPFKFGVSKNSTTTQSLQRPDASKLSLSQALTITAGLAGLVGLCSGAIIRFSLANSSNARFLSPLQTFPTLSNWTPEIPQENPNPPYPSEKTEPQVENFERRPWREDSDTSFDLQEEEATWTEDTFSNSTAEATVDGSTFDSFAERSNEEWLKSQDPWKRLEEGPQLSQSADKGSSNEVSIDYLEGIDSNYYEKAYDDPEDEPQYDEAPSNYEEDYTDGSYLDEEAGLYEAENYTPGIDY